MYIGSYLRGATVAIPFNTRGADGLPITFAGTPRLRVLNAADLTLVEADVVPSIDVGGVTGRHLATIDTSDPAYATVTEFVVAVQAGTVDGDTVVGEILRTFSLNTGVLPAGAVAASSFAASALNAAALAADAVTEIQSGLATAAGVTAATAPLATAAALAVVDALVTALPSAVQTADALLARNQQGGANSAPTVSTALAGGLMKISINTTSGVMTVLHGDDTVAYTRTLTRAQLNAIVSSV